MSDKLIEVAAIVTIGMVPGILIGWGYGYSAGFRRVLNLLKGVTRLKREDNTP